MHLIFLIYKIPKSFIQKLFKNFIKRCKKIIELNGGRLEPVHLKQIRKEVKDEEKEVKEEKEDFEDGESKKLKLKMIYNKNELIQKAKKEIALIRKKIKEKKREIRKNKKEYNKAKKYSVRIGKNIQAVKDKGAAKKIKNIELQNYNFRVKWIKKCISENLEKYFKYFNKVCDNMEIDGKAKNKNQEMKKDIN